MLLEVKDLTIEFENNNNRKLVVDSISFGMEEKEIVGIVGESGSGKTITALSLMGLQSKEAKIRNGSILFKNNEIVNKPDAEFERIRGKEVAMIFQEPMTSLNPVQRIGVQIEEMLILHTKCTKAERTKRVSEALKEVELLEYEKVMNAYPHELSGGMRQRVMIAMAMILKPKLIIADEPTTALDVSVQAQILRLLLKLNKEFGISILLISHDIGVVRKLCSRIIVMEAGKIVEMNRTNELLANPKEEYTQKLLGAVPSITRKPLYSQNHITGEPVVKVEHLNVYYYKNGRIHQKDKVKIVKDVSFEVHPLEVVGVVGESGSGKSTLAKAVVGLNKNFEGVITCKESHPQMVFQDPYSSLNQAKKVSWILEEPLKIKGGYTREARRLLVEEKLKEVGLSVEIKDRKVNQLSGGQRQRICIAIALMQQSSFIVLDEAVSALDVTVQRQILKLLTMLKEKYQLSFLFISHDMNVIHEMCNRVIVMYQGKIIEEGNTKEVFSNPKEEYTKKLIQAVL